MGISPRGILLAAGTAAVLAGCANQPTIHSEYRGQYDPGMLSYAASRGGMKVDIRGNPFQAADRPQLDRVVTQRLREAKPGPRFDFFTEAPEGYSSPYRVVLFFDAPAGTQVQNLCSMGPQPAGEVSGNIRVNAAFCSSGVAVTRVAGAVDRGESPEDSGFRRLIGQVARALFPITNPDMGNGSGEFDM